MSRKVLDLPVKVTVRALFAMFIKDKESALVEAARKAAADVGGDSSAPGGAPPAGSAAEDSSAVASMRDLCNGLLNYFERSLPTLLLYKNERPQFEAFRASSSSSSSSRSSSSSSSSSSVDAGAASPQPLSDVYGLEHLLRLFVKLPYIVSASTVTEGEARVLLSRVGEMLRYMQKNVGALQSGRYREPRGGEWIKGEEERKTRDAAKEKVKENAEARAVKEVERVEAVV